MGDDFPVPHLRMVENGGKDRFQKDLNIISRKKGLKPKNAVSNTHVLNDKNARKLLGSNPYTNRNRSNVKKKLCDKAARGTRIPLKDRTEMKKRNLLSGIKDLNPTLLTNTLNDSKNKIRLNRKHGRHERKEISIENFKVLFSRHRRLRSSGANRYDDKVKTKIDVKNQFEGKTCDIREDDINVLFTREKKGQNTLNSQTDCPNKGYSMDPYPSNKCHQKQRMNIKRTHKPTKKSARKVLRLKEKSYRPSLQQGSIAKENELPKENYFPKSSYRRDLQVYHVHRGGFGDTANDIKKYSDKGVGEKVANTPNLAMASKKVLLPNFCTMLLKYFLVLLVILAWSPCIVAFLLLWLISYPLRPQLQKWRVKRKAYQDNRKYLHRQYSTIMKWMNNDKWFHVKPLEMVSSLLKDDDAIKMPKPDQSKQYDIQQLYHRSWISQPRGTCAKLKRKRRGQPDHSYSKHNNIVMRCERANPVPAFLLGAGETPVQVMKCQVETCQGCGKSIKKKKKKCKCETETYAQEIAEKENKENTMQEGVGSRLKDTIIRFDREVWGGIPQHGPCAGMSSRCSFPFLSCVFKIYEMFVECALCCLALCIWLPCLLCLYTVYQICFRCNII